MICTPPTGEEKERRAAALPSNSAAIQSEKSVAHDTTAMREFLVAALRCARCRALLLANEIDAVGVAVSRELVIVSPIRASPACLAFAAHRPPTASAIAISGSHTSASRS